MDKIETINNSTIQHGRDSDRIYLMDLHPADHEIVAEKLDKIAQKNNYSKIFAKVPERAKEIFQSKNYSIEADVPFFYNGKEKGLFMAKFLSPSRLKLTEQKRAEISQNIRLAKSQKKYNTIPRNEAFSYRLLTEADSSALAEVYKVVFKSYPFPIHDPKYLEETMQDNIVYFGAFKNEKLVAAASSEIYKNAENAEMTDFATLPDYRGNKLGLILLDLMEKTMQQQSIKSLYTIARAHSAGMNITFSRKGYRFAGTLINNTNIAGSIESMNVWYK